MATVAGIEIRIHASFLLLVALVALGSTAEEGPGLASALIWLAALFACVVIHELAHSVVARRNGIPIVEIELLPIGGVSKMARSPDDPAVEFRIAAAGPIASMVLGGAFAVLALLIGVSMWPPTLYGGGFLARLSWANLLLAGFNLVPALPLDGGRVFRALLAQRTDRERATRVAAMVGRLVASLVIAAGIFFVNLWLLVIGVFVYFGSSAEETAATIHERIKDVRVRDVMIRDPIALPAHVLVAQLTDTLWHSAQREFPVVTAQGTYIGLVTAAMLLRAAPGATVGDIADTAAPTLAPDDRLEASGLLDDELTAAAVVSAGRVVGLARATDAALVAQRLIQQAAGSSR
ncbi:MAG: site-2 protease family protein [Acidimicrobiia bacterium]